MPTPSPLRAPAVPLVCHDPYFSIWSCTDHPADDHTRHWTGHPNSLAALLRVDGRLFRLMGAPWDKKVPPAALISTDVWPTRTVYTFEAGGVQARLTFVTPAIMTDLDLLSRPVTYVFMDAKNTDNRTHTVQTAFAGQASICVNSDDMRVETGRFNVPGLSVLRAGSTDQRVLERSGDDLRIEWGYLYLATPPGKGMTDALVPMARFREQFKKTGNLAAGDDIRDPAPVAHDWPVLGCTFDLGRLAPGREAGRFTAIAYDDLFAIEFLHRRLRGYWRRKGMTFGDMLRTAVRDADRIREQCRIYDRRLMRQLARQGGPHYAQLCALAYRQSIAAHKLVADLDGTPLFFSKENFSNGCIATVDVTYPSAPLYLWLNPELLKGMLKPILDYAAMDRWQFPFAPHDLGQYPLANGQVYGGGEKTEENQMPVEECGNMLILLAAAARAEGDAGFAERYWLQVSQWAAYLADRGLDPANQLCTDDFAGHLGHNVNLSVKAIVALGGYALLCGMLGRTTEKRKYRRIAGSMAKKWMRMADDGDHYRLAFDRPGTWSQKYNLVWDRLLDLKLFPAAVYRKEAAWYRKVQTPLGLPLDNRRTYTKLDWLVWSAALTGRKDDFRALFEPAWTWVNSTPTRVPLTDWYETRDGRMVGFQARSVVSGVFIPMLT